MRVVAIGGEPATGKTTLVRSVIEKLGSCRPFSSKGEKTTIRGLQFSTAKVMILGIYELGETFAGTDRFSMAVMPDAIRFFRFLSESKDYEGWTILFEGDRLFSETLLRVLAELPLDLRIFVLTAPPEVLEERHRERGDSQSSTWLAGRKTKVDRLAASFPHIQLSALCPESTSQAVQSVLQAARGEMPALN